ncbi:zinc finger HIT domain-containing protein 3 isoform X3 [Brassica rapa]|uniref:zinc finger HIT domain-containing protein 3 isoform X3 n=1 Tax=Brassica campestris TaxID=3711 RepID=UPI0004F19DC7|nr:zinc finger HIT domain-containing protein 3 isoform X3 [Brassica rapa]
MSPRATQTCGICERVVSKYKCPCCLVPYCSVGCFKKHKELPCVKPSSTDEKPATSPAKEVPVETTDVVEKTESKAVGNSDASPTKEAQMAVAIPVNAEEAKHVVDKTQLEAIASSSEIREALKDESLQKLITKIDSSSNPLKELDEAMGEEAFRMLKDKILSNLSKKK